MTYVITSTCIDVKDGACQKVCPVECIYEGGRMMYIQPEECINCGVCLSICPVQAIYEEDEVPAAEAAFTAANAEFFAAAVTGWGEPGGAAPRFVTDRDHPLIGRVSPSPLEGEGGVGGRTRSTARVRTPPTPTLPLKGGGDSNA